MTSTSPLCTQLDHGVAEVVGPRPAGDLDGQPGLRVDHTDAVELVRLVIDGRVVAPPLLRDDVDEDRSVERTRPTEGDLHGVDVVAVDRADVLHAGIHNQPHFHNHPDAVYSRIAYSSKSNDFTHVICNGRWLMRDRVLLTVDEAAAREEAIKVAAEIDAFVIERESSPYNKLVLLSGVQRQESFEVQVKVPLDDDTPLRNLLKSEAIQVSRFAHYRQYDHYFLFDSGDPDADRLRYREDEFIDDETGEVTQVRARLTLMGQGDREEFPNVVTHGFQSN